MAETRDGFGRLREPYLRRPLDKYAANLPEGKSCGDCIHIRRCALLFGHVKQDEICDWLPTRFVERSAESNSAEPEGVTK